MRDLFTLKDFDPASTHRAMDFATAPRQRRREERQRRALAERLSVFYHWRFEVLSSLHKFGEVNPNKALFVGVNAKMILDNFGRTQQRAFYGPLSTTTSFHVARTFATAKGMVLQLATQFPSKKLLRAFNAASLSDYPEEHEYLIGSIYPRVVTVLTRPLKKSWTSFAQIDADSDSASASKARAIFFAVHLFRHCVFAMSLHSEYWLCAFLFVHGGFAEDRPNLIRNTKFARRLQRVRNGEEMRGDTDDQRRLNALLRLLNWKFDNFRRFPNRRQILRIGAMSEGLRPYFMDFARVDILKRRQFRVSLAKILQIYPNLREVHFENEYRFDDAALQEMTATDLRSLERIKFLYINANFAANAWHFVHPNALKAELLQRLDAKRWRMSHGAFQGKGYRIVLTLRPWDIEVD